ncbi:hypothetical protein [Sulfurisoma sediminicola]|uniref:Uncharacterized protein n=1 Tax=Sulfurisoma sediminicola TaxID=1381557 RepID=A0A497XA12_9PROT|nr:hypothetical protein [Sulfurisoma sediminicola]RLJ62794.1 hypothetical protein DFR35_2611 [Sulfurisoma sediminicola]
MNPSRRRTLQAACGALLLSVVAHSRSASGETLIRINVPGPDALPFLPIDLIPGLNFDREVGVRDQPGGIRAIEDMLAGNADLAALLKTLPGIFSPDARFSIPQIGETDVFLRAAMPGLKLTSAHSLIDARWAGQRQ